MPAPSSTQRPVAKAASGSKRVTVSPGGDGHKLVLTVPAAVAAAAAASVEAARPQTRKRSKYKGVTQLPDGTFKTQIAALGTIIRLGDFSDEETAAKYDRGDTH